MIFKRLLTKKSLVPVLLLILALSLASCGAPAQSAAPGQPAAASNENFNATGYPIVNDPITLKIFYAVDSRDTLDVSNPFAKALEEKTNIKADYEFVISTDFATRYNLMMSSGAYSDVIMGGRGVGLGIDDYGRDQQILIPLNDLIDEWMPNYKSYLTDTHKKILTRSDGNMYSIGTTSEDGISVEIKYFVNERWLNELKISEPTTVDEVTAMLRTFKEKYPYGYPLTGLLRTGAWPVASGILNMFGVTIFNGFQQIDNGANVEYTAYMPGYREAFEYMHMLYTEGLIDPEFLTQDANALRAKYTENNVGFAFLFSNRETDNEQFWKDMKAIMPPKADGHEPMMRRRETNPYHHTAVTAANKYVPETMRWLDTWLEHDNMILNVYGVEGETYEMIDGKVSQFSGADIPLVTDFGFGGRNALYMLTAPVIEKYVLASPGTIEARRLSNLYINAGVVEPFHTNNAINSHAPREAAENDRYFLLLDDINQLVYETMNNFVVSGVTDQSWQKYMDQLETAGMKEFKELAREFYSRFIK